MQITNHPLIEQTGEHLDAQGRRFGTVFRLKGRHTLTQLRQLLDKECIAPIQRDIQDGAYRVAFLEPDSVELLDECTTRMYDDAVTSQCNKGDIFHVSNRDDSRYSGAAFHTHNSTRCTTALCMESGSMPSAFAVDEPELLGVIQDNVTLLPSEIQADLESKLLAKNILSIRQRAIDTTQFLFTRFADFYGSNRQKFRRHQQAILNQLTQKVLRKPTLGHINVMAGDVIHGAGSNPRGSDDAGELFVQHWQGREE